MAKAVKKSAPSEDGGMEKVVKVYLKIRDAKAALTREFEEKAAKLDADMEKIENHLLNFLNVHKMDSAKAGAATFYKQEEIKPAAADWDTIWTWIMKNDAFEMMERRLKKTFIKEYMETHKGKIPPGVTVHREFVVRVRRGS